MLKAALLATVLTCLLPVAAHAADAPAPAASTLSPAQRAEVENIIKQYLTVDHPEVVMTAVQNLQQKQQVEEATKAHAAVLANKDKLFNDANTPVAGNPKGDVTIVEFFDYQCGYCKMSEESVEQLLKADKNIKFVYKQFPILGNMSTEASKAAVASIKQGKFPAFHNALMNKKEHLTKDMIYSIAKETGLDVEKLKKDAESKETTDIIGASLKLGQDLGVRGTPMFIVNDNVYPGALQHEDLKKAVETARNAAKK